MTCKCNKCSHIWHPRTEDPKACPRCKRYDWRGKPEEEQKRVQPVEEEFPGHNTPDQTDVPEGDIQLNSTHSSKREFFSTFNSTQPFLKKGILFNHRVRSG